jgi:hypothetical protein
MRLHHDLIQIKKGEIFLTRPFKRRGQALKAAARVEISDL